MDIRVLKYFLAVAKCGSITKAAEELHITQPTLSRQLMDLEEELGTKLFIRGKREIRLTDDGTLFQQRAKEITELSDKTCREFQTDDKLVSGVISIGCVESFGSRFFFDILESFIEKYPDIKFEIYNGYSDDIKEKIDRGLIDIGVLCEPVEISKYDFMRLPIKDRWGIIVSKNNPLAEKETISIEDLFGEKMLVPRRELTQTELYSWFREDWEKVNIVGNFNLLSNTVFLIEKGLFSAICLNSAIDIRYNDKIKFIPFAQVYETGNVIVWKKNRLFSSPTALLIQKITMLLKHNKQ